MSADAENYVLDANAFIQAKRRFYGLDFCPGYWQALVWYQRRERLCSIDRVRDELLRGGDDLSEWVRDQFGNAAFAATSTSEVADVFRQMLEWVMAQAQFLDPAKDGFQHVADGWLAAFAKAEEFDPVARKKVPLPNVCRAFDVEVITPFEMLRRLNVKLKWQPPE